MRMFKSCQTIFLTLCTSLCHGSLVIFFVFLVKVVKAFCFSLWQEANFKDIWHWLLPSNHMPHWLFFLSSLWCLESFCWQSNSVIQHPVGGFILLSLKTALLLTKFNRWQDQFQNLTFQCKLWARIFLFLFLYNFYWMLSLYWYKSFTSNFHCQNS